MEKKDNILNKLNELYSSTNVHSLRNIKSLVDSAFKFKKIEEILANITKDYPIMNELPKQLTDDEYELLSEDEKVYYDFYQNSENEELVANLKSRLTDEKLITITREIIKKIDPNFVKEFDNFIIEDKLKFSDSFFLNIIDYEEPIGAIGFHTLGSAYVQPNNSNLDDYSIRIQRRYTYNDVLTLVHEFIHHTNSRMARKFEKNHKTEIINKTFTEFVSIYFEIMACDYLIQVKNISLDMIDCSWRLKSCINSAKIIRNYILIFVYSKYKNIEFESYKRYLNEEYGYINSEENLFQEYNESLHCIDAVFYNIQFLKSINYKDTIAALLEEHLLSSNAHYLGTLLAFAMRKYGNKHQVLQFNSYIRGSEKNEPVKCAKEIIGLINIVGTDDVFTEMEKFITEYVPESAYIEKIYLK